MTQINQSTKFDAIPFTARAGWSSERTYEAWWEDPRDLFEIVIVPKPGAQINPSDIAVSYWQHSWPKTRVPKGELVGSGRSGWLAIDDWTNGRWQEADTVSQSADDAVSIGFAPVNHREFPDQVDFPAPFRRTIKLRLSFIGPAQEGIATVRAYTDSTWQETDVMVEWNAADGAHGCRSGHLEAFNGEILRVAPLDDRAMTTDGAGWQANASAGETAGVCARIRYVVNEDPNSYDRTIVTARCIEAAFSVLIDDVIEDSPLYLPDLGAFVALADSGHTMKAWTAQWQADHPQKLHQRIAALPEQTWENAWRGMPAKARRLYFVLGCEGSRQKFGVNPNGDIFLRENFIRRVPGKDTPRIGWEGSELRFEFGLPAEPADRGILEDRLPILGTAWTDHALNIEQECYATWLQRDILAGRWPGDDPVVCMMRFRLTNQADRPRTAMLTLRTVGGDDTPEALHLDGDRAFAGERLRCLLDANGQGEWVAGEQGLTYRLELPPGAGHDLFVKIPFVLPADADAVARLRNIGYEEERTRVATFWRDRISSGAQLQTPNATLNAFYDTHVMHMLVINDREPGADRNVARCGGFSYGSFPDEGIMVTSDLVRRGYIEDAERCLDLYVNYQGTAPLPGNYQSDEGVLYGSGGYEVAGYNRNQGWVLWGLAEHYRYTRDRAWLEETAPTLIAGCDWISRERAATMQDLPDGERPIEYGFLPTGSLEDVTDYWTWLSSNAYAYLGLRSAAEVLTEIDHPEAARLTEDAQAYGNDLRAGFFEAAARSPVVKLRDGTWVPHFPPRLERRGRDFGWLREVLEGAAHLIYCGIIAPDEPAAQWIIDDYEDNLFNSDQYGYPVTDFEAQWFGWGGFSMQPNLLIWPLIYLWRDEPVHYLRSYFNPFASAFYPDTLMLTEHPLPTLADWAGDHFKTSDEANSTYWLRLMFLAEHGDELFVGQAIPRAWFADGLTMRLDRALTHFGEASVEFVSHAATGQIRVKLSPPHRNPPARIRLRVRHPEGRPIWQVRVNGLSHQNFDVEKEEILLKTDAEPMDIRVLY